MRLRKQGQEMSTWGGVLFFLIATTGSMPWGVFALACARKIRASETLVVRRVFCCCWSYLLERGPHVDALLILGFKAVRNAHASTGRELNVFAIGTHRARFYIILREVRKAFEQIVNDLLLKAPSLGFARLRPHHTLLLSL